MSRFLAGFVAGAAAWLVAYWWINQDSDGTAADGPGNQMVTGADGGIFAATSTGDGGSEWAPLEGVEIDPARSMRPRLIDGEAQWGNHR